MSESTSAVPAAPTQAADSDPGLGGYSASSITVLEGLEAVRKRPGMYIGSTGERGLHHLVTEVVDNAVDEALAGHCDAITVTLLPDGGVRVADNGRGIPVDMHPVEKRPALEVVLTTLHAGGKFDGESYAVSGGLHGVGAAVVNALSTRLEVEVRRDGFVWSQSYLNTVPTPLQKGAPTDEHGTTMAFWADPEIFTETTTYSRETLHRRLQEMAFLNKGLSITLRDERDVELLEERVQVAVVLLLALVERVVVEGFEDLEVERVVEVDDQGAGTHFELRVGEEDEALDNDDVRPDRLLGQGLVGLQHDLEALGLAVPALLHRQAHFVPVLSQQATHLPAADRGSRHRVADAVAGGNQHLRHGLTGSSQWWSIRDTPRSGKAPGRTRNGKALAMIVYGSSVSASTIVTPRR